MFCSLRERARVRLHVLQPARASERCCVTVPRAHSHLNAHACAQAVKRAACRTQGRRNAARPLKCAFHVRSRNAGVCARVRACVRACVPVCVLSYASEAHQSAPGAHTRAHTRVRTRAHTVTADVRSLGRLRGALVTSRSPCWHGRQGRGSAWHAVRGCRC
jgi:hypothetical protein